MIDYYQYSCSFLALLCATGHAEAEVSWCDLLASSFSQNSEVEAVVRSPTNMAAAKIAAVDFNKMTSLY